MKNAKLHVYIHNFAIIAIIALCLFLCPNVSAQITNSQIRFQAKLVEKDPAITQGLTWRIFSGKLPLKPDAKPIVESKDATLLQTIANGNYVINVSYGRVTAFKQIFVDGNPISDQIVLNAGGIKLSAEVGGKPIPSSKVLFAIYTSGQKEDERKLILNDIKSGTIVRLPAGEYYVTSRYGDGNAFISSDMTIQPGKLTDAVIHHRAASMTLKLANQAGGEALINTNWTILTPTGDTVSEFLGAYVTTTLTEGEYVVVARYESRIYNTQFSVEAGNDREIELLTK